MFIRNCWYVAAWDYELPKGELVARSIINEPIVLYRAQDGGVVALADRCCHRLAPLSQGRIEGDDLRCLYHGLKFDRAGRCIEIPGQEMIPQTACVTAYPVVEQHSWIWVWMGDAAKADTSLIPQAKSLDDPNWILRSRYKDFEANYLLINDNQTDFSHLSFLHRNTFGTGEEWARYLPKITPLERGIRVQRWTPETRPPGSPPSPFFKGGEPEGGVVNRLHYDYLVPGVMLMSSEFHPSSAMQLSHDAPPVTEPLHGNFSCQAVTPMTDKTTRLFFSWGPRACEDEEVAEILIGVAEKAFEEDRIMIEGQQKIIDLSPEARMLNTSLDQGPNLMRSIVDRLLRAEGSKLEPLAAAE